MNTQDWQRIGPRLHDIEYYTQALTGNVRMIQLAAQSLPARPAWGTMAREELGKAEQQLQIALAVVRGAREIYDRLPVIVETWKDAAE